MIAHSKPRSEQTPASTRAQPRPAATADTGAETWSPLAVVLAALPATALAELLLIRTFYRVGIYIPKQGAFLAVYRTLTGVGSFALNLSSVLGVMGVGMLAVGAWRRGLRNPATALGGFLLVVLASDLWRTPGVAPLERLLFVLAVAAAAWPFVRRRARPVQRVAVAAVAIGALLSSYAGLTDQAGMLVPSGHDPGGAIGAQLVGEAVVLVAAFLLFAAWVADEGIRPRPIVAGAVTGATLLLAWWVNGAVVGILVLWTAGLRMYLPVWAYGLSLGALSAAAVGWVPKRPWRAAGCSLLLVGGFLMDSTYLQTLVLLGVVLLTDGVAVGGLPAVPRRRRSTGRS